MLVEIVNLMHIIQKSINVEVVVEWTILVLFEVGIKSLDLSLMILAQSRYCTKSKN